MADVWQAAGHAVLAGGAVLGLTWAALLRVRPPARRHQLAAWGVRGAVVAAALSFLPGWIRVPLPRWPAAEPAVVVVTPGATAAAPDALVYVADDVGEEVAVVEEFAAVPAPTTTPPAAPAAPAAAEPAPDRAAQIGPLVFLAYGGVAAAGLVQIALGQWALWRLRRTGRPAPAAVQAVFASLEGGGGCRLLVSDAVPSPVCFGLFRPTILLPPGMLRATAEELRWVLAHELDHLRRGDAVTGVWVAAARAVFFPVPWFWAVRRELLLAQEYLADAAAAAAGGAAADYAAFLVNLSGRPGLPRAAKLWAGAHGVRAGKSDLYRRIAMLLEAKNRGDGRGAKLWSALAAGGVLSAAVVLSGVSVARTEEPARAVAVAVTDDPPAPPAAVRVDVKVVAVKTPAEIVAIRAKIEAAAKANDVPALRAAMDELEKAVAKPVVVPVGQPPVMVPATPGFGIAGVDVVRGSGGKVILIDNDPEAEKALESLRKAAEELKDQPEAKAALEKSIEAYKKQLTAGGMRVQMVEGGTVRGGLARVNPLPAVPLLDPLAPVPGIDAAAPERAKMAAQLKAARDKTDRAFQEQMEAQKANPDAVKALMAALAAHDAAIDQALKAIPGGANLFAIPNNGDFGAMLQPIAPFTFKSANAARPVAPVIGFQAAAVPAALVEQLDLPRAQGVLVTQVVPAGPAAVAGLKVNDVVLEIAGKTVPADPAAVAKIVADLKPAEAFDMTVVRKGKKETVKGVKLPEPVKKVVLGEVVPPKGVSFTTMQSQVQDDAFTVSGKTGTASYELTGAFADGKSVPSKIVVTVGDKATTYSKLSEVPTEHLPAVAKLLGSVGGGR